mgnify:CR=1 FL=1
MRTILELANTTTGTSNIDSLTPEVWSAQAEQQGENLRVARNFIKVDRSLVGKPGDVAHILKGARLVQSVDVETNKTEASDATFYALDDYGSLDLTPAPYYSAVQVTEDTVEEVNIDVLADATTYIAEALAQYEDVQILSTGQSNAGNSVFGGDATSNATLDTGDILTTDLFANAIREIRKDRYQPDVCFLAPDQENVFLKDSQFVNAAQYGSNKVVANGELGEYLGVKIIVTNNVATVSPNTGTAHACVMWDSKKSLVLALKHDIRIKSDYYVPSGNYRIVGRLKFAVGVLFSDAICKIAVTDT